VSVSLSCSPASAPVSSLSLPDALPIFNPQEQCAMTSLFVSHGAPTFALEPGLAGPALTRLGQQLPRPAAVLVVSPHWMTPEVRRSEEHTSELQSRENLVCRLLLEKKKT